MPEPGEQSTSQIDQHAHLVLVGSMGSGKTTVGRLLADSLDRRLVDNDALLFDRESASASELAEAAGLDRLHDAELGVLRTALRSEPAAVVTAAASVVDHPEIDHLLEPFVVVWLDAPADVLVTRASQGSLRPLDPRRRREFIEARAATRDPGYARISDLRVDVAENGPEEACDQIVTWFRRRSKPPAA